MKTSGIEGRLPAAAITRLIAAGLAYGPDLLEGETVSFTRLEHPVCPSAVERGYPEIDSKNVFSHRVATTHGRCLRGGSNTVTRHSCPAWCCSQAGATARIWRLHPRPPDGH